VCCSLRICLSGGHPIRHLAALLRTAAFSGWPDLTSQRTFTQSQPLDLLALRTRSDTPRPLRSLLDGFSHARNGLREGITQPCATFGYQSTQANTWWKPGQKPTSQDVSLYIQNCSSQPSQQRFSCQTFGSHFAPLLGLWRNKKHLPDRGLNASFLLINCLHFANWTEGLQANYNLSPGDHFYLALLKYLRPFHACFIGYSARRPAAWRRSVTESWRRRESKEGPRRRAP